MQIKDLTAGGAAVGTSKVAVDKADGNTYYHTLTQITGGDWVEASAALSADRLLFWDESANAVTWLTPRHGLTISGTTVDVDLSAYNDAVDIDLVATSSINLDSGGSFTMFGQNGLDIDPGDGEVEVSGFLRTDGGNRVSTQFDRTDATLANVTGLGVSVAAGEIYEFTARLFVDADTTGGHKYAIGGTCTATVIKYQIQSWDNADASLDINARKTALAGASGAAGPTGLYTEIKGFIEVGSAGTLTVQFAQNTGSGTSSVLTGSTFMVTLV